MKIGKTLLGSFLMIYTFAAAAQDNARKKSKKVKVNPKTEEVADAQPVAEESTFESGKSKRLTPPIYTTPSRPDLFSLAYAPLPLQHLQEGFYSEAAIGYYKDDYKSSVDMKGTATGSSTTNSALVLQYQKALIAYRTAKNPLVFGLGYTRGEMQISIDFESGTNDSPYYFGRFYFIHPTAGVVFPESFFVLLGMDQIVYEFRERSRTNDRLSIAAGVKNEKFEGSLSLSPSKKREESGIVDVVLTEVIRAQATIWAQRDFGWMFKLTRSKESEQNQRDTDQYKDQYILQIGPALKSPTTYISGTFNYLTPDHSTSSEQSANGQYYAMYGVQVDGKVAMTPKISLGGYLSYLMGSGTHSYDKSGTTYDESDSHKAFELAVNGSLKL